MAPKKKKAVKNGFYYFMLDVQQKETKRGNRCSLNEAAQIASPLWAAMDADEKRTYNERAAASGNKGSDDLSRKFTSLGVSYAIIDAAEREKEEFHNNMIATIRSTVQSLNNNTTFKTKKYFVSHVNYFYKTEDNYYAPAEFAMSVFSLERGLIETIHFFVDIGKIPLGMKFVAFDWSSKTHQVPINDPSWTHGEKDYLLMFNKVRSFITKHADSNDMPPIYTMYDCINTNYSHSAVRCIFDNMCEAAHTDPALFKVYNIAILFYELRLKCSSDDIPSVAIMKSEIDKDVFSYAKDIGCFYHEDKDVSVYCSMSMIIRWIFTICDHCCKHLNIQLILGCHIPKEACVNWKQETNYVKDSGYIKKGTNPANDQRQPLTVVDYGKLKEKRLEEKQQHHAIYEKAESIRLPKTTLTSKIGANFGVSSSSRTSENEDDDSDDGWVPVSSRSRGGAHVSGHGRGRGAPQEDRPFFYPLSGRGRSISMNYNK